MPLYIEKINGDVDRPTNQPTDQPTDQPGEYRAICLFRKLENRKKAEICNSLKMRSYLMGPMYLSVENIYVLSWTSSQMRDEKGLSMVAFCPTTF